MNIKSRGPIEIADSIYWLGAGHESDFLQFNSFLIYRQEKGIIIDPGPRKYFREIFEAASSIAPIEDISAMVLSSQDPEVCSSLTSWEEMGFNGTYICHWRSAMFIEAFGLLSPFFKVADGDPEEQDPFLSLKFIPYPFLHSPGVILTYDRGTGTLFSSDLFGGFGYSRDLYAGEDYMGKVLYYHRKFIPPRKGRAAALKDLEALGVKRICPHHGCLIDRDLDRYFTVSEGESAPDLNEEQETQEREIQEAEKLILGRDKTLVDPLTGLYNSLFLEKFMPEFLNNHESGAIVHIRLDDMIDFNREYGREEGDLALLAFSTLLQENKPEDVLLLKEQSILFCLIFPDYPEAEYLSAVDDLRTTVRGSGSFIKDMTCSAAVVGLHELKGETRSRRDLLARMLRNRLFALDSRPPDSVIDASEGRVFESGENGILLIEPDPLYSRLLSEYLDSQGYPVHVCPAGGDAVREIDLLRPRLIISEVHVPQLDGFRIREKQRQINDIRDIPFLFISHQKTENIIHRANRLGVSLILKKPVILDELAGLIQSLAGKGTGNG